MDENTINREAFLEDQIDKLRQRLEQAVRERDGWHQDFLIVKNALDAAAEDAWQSEVIEPEMRDLLIGEDNEYADKQDWLESKLAKWFESDA